MYKIIHIPKGTIKLDVNQSYDVKSLLDLDSSVINQFVHIFKLPGLTPKYEVIYTLSQNKLLTSPLSIIDEELIYYIETDLSKDMPNLNIKASQIYEWLRKIKANPHVNLPQSFRNSFINQEPECKIINNDIRTKLQETLIHEFPDKIITPSMVERAFELIDTYYLNQYIRNKLKFIEYNIQFEVSNKMTRSAGIEKTNTKDKLFTITISEHINNILNDKRMCNGLLCHGSIDCLLVVMQHEMTHVIVELIKYEKGITTRVGYYAPHGQLFTDLVLKHFGHTKNTHQLFDTDDSPKIEKKDVKIGQIVSFPFKQQMLRGQIIKLNPKRVKIKISDDSVYNVYYSTIKP